MAKTFLLTLTLCLTAPAISALAQVTPPAAPEVSLLEKAFDLDAAAQTDEARAQAAELYIAAAAAGDTFAQLRLGYLYETGDGVPQDYALARQQYQAAVDGGLNAARVRLAMCHLEGWGGPADRPAFAREITRGAEGGDPLAQRILASMYFAGIAVAKNQAEGVRWLEKAARQGDAEAQVDMGRSLEAVQRRVLARTNQNLARTWYEQAAEQEYFTAMRAMARSLLADHDRENHWPEARRWLELATEGGDAEAPFIQAICELLLPGGAPDRAESARTLLTTASTRGNPRATEVLQLELAGRTLVEAARYVMETPFEDRYMQNLAVNAQEGENVRPVPYRIVRPLFPRALSLTGVTGTVMLEFIIDTKGRVVKVAPKSSSHPLFTERAVEAIQQWRFHPGKVKGRLVNVRVNLPLEFQLEKETLNGIDDLFMNAVSLAEALGGQAERDTRDLRMAQPLTPLPTPPAVRALVAKDSACLFVLVLDEEGRPIRGHVLDANPKELGPPLLEIALKHRFEPRLINGKPVQSNVLLTFLTGRYAPPAGN